MQGKDENVLTLSDKLEGLLKKLQKMWQLHTEKSLFPLTFNVGPQGDINGKLILNHLMTLEDKMAQYCPNISVDKSYWVRNSYTALSESPTELCLEHEKQLVKLQTDKILQMNYTDVPLIKFWLLAIKEYPVMELEAVNILQHF